MQKTNTFLFFLLLLLGLKANAQKVDLSLRFNASTKAYDVYAKPDFSKGEFLINAGSQITVLIPFDFVDQPIPTKNYAGEWTDQQLVFAPPTAPEHDFHTFIAKGETINFTKGAPTKLFSFQLPLSYDHKGVRLFVEGIDPAVSAESSNNRVGHFFANEITLTDFYRKNFDLEKDIKGHIKDWRGYPLDGVEVTLGNKKFQSLYDGRFDFKQVLVEDEANFYFDKNISSQAGITTADLIQLQNHLTGSKPFDQPYQWIAADIDNSGTVTYKDLELLKQVINGEFTDAGWRILPSEWMNDTKYYQKSIPNILQIRKAERVFSQDFIAIKIGDVDGSYTVKENIPNNILPSSKALTINLLNENMKAGKTYEIPFSTNDFAHLTAYQASLKIENATIVDLENTFDKYPGLSLKQLPNDVIVVNWLNDKIGRRVSISNSGDGNSHQSETAILDLTIIPKKDGRLSDFITLLHEPLRTEAFDTDGKVMTLQLLFRTAPEEKVEFALYQNRPNPFTVSTDINYYLPKDGAASLTLLNEAGQVLKVFNGKGQKGFNSFTINGAELPKGLIIYQLKTDFGELTKKMLLVK